MATFRRKTLALTHGAAGWLATTAGCSGLFRLQQGIGGGRPCLAADILGLGEQPMRRAPQRIREMTGQYDQAHEMLAPEGEVVQLLKRG